MLVYDRTLNESQFDFPLKICPVFCKNDRQFINKVSELETGRLSTDFLFRYFCINRDFSRATSFFHSNWTSLTSKSEYYIADEKLQDFYLFEECKQKNTRHILNGEIQLPVLASFLIIIQLLWWRIRTWGFILNRLGRLHSLFKNQLISYTEAYPVGFCNTTQESWIWKGPLRVSPQAFGNRLGLEYKV